MKLIIVGFFLFVRIFNVDSQVIHECKFYKDKWNGLYLYGRPQKITVNYYDYNTKELQTGGIAYRSLIEFNKYGYCITHRLYYNHPPKSESSYLFEYSDSILIKEKESHDEINYITEFDYMPSGLLNYKAKYRCENSKNSFYDGEKYEYSQINNISKIVKIISIRNISKDSLILGDTTYFEYDNNARLIKRISPTNMRDNNFDYNSKTILTYKYDNNITTTIKTYSNKSVSETSYERNIGELSFWASSYLNADKMTFDKSYNILWREGYSYRYDFDAYGNWICKYKNDVKIEERIIEY